MQGAHMTNRMSSAGSMLQLPVQSMPVNRSITGSTLRGDSGVQPQQFGEGLAAWLAAAGAVAVGGLVAYGVEKGLHHFWPKTF